MRTAKETWALRTTSKSSNFRKVYVTFCILDTTTRDDVYGLYVIFVEAVNKMAQMQDKWRNTELNASLY